MAIPADLDLKYRRLFQRYPAKGRLMIFGRPSALFDDAAAAEELFKGYGFDEVHTLDASPDRGASRIHDLNQPLPAEWAGQYDMVMTGGTLQHVFNFGQALMNAAALLAVDGTLVTSAPVSGRAGHGFYQISPTLFFDFFAANGFEFHYSSANLLFREQQIRRSFALYPGEGQLLDRTDAVVSHSLTVRKVAGATSDQVPLRGVHLQMHDGRRRRYSFRASEPAEIAGDVSTVVAMQRFALAHFNPRDGHYIAAFRGDRHLASLPRKPFRSTGVVYEDGVLLPWIVSEPAAVDERPGSFHHGPGFVHFTTSDGSDPRENGRRYEIAFCDIAQLLRAP